MTMINLKSTLEEGGKPSQARNKKGAMWETYEKA